MRGKNKQTTKKNTETIANHEKLVYTKLEETWHLKKYVLDKSPNSGSDCNLSFVVCLQK